MGNSKLATYTKHSPNNSGKRKYAITRITPHCVVGQLSVQTLGDLFARSSYQASSNYGIGYDGRIGLYVDENLRSWCSSSADNDNRAVTIECASAVKSPYEMNGAVYKSLVNLCIDICERNGKEKLIWIPDKTKALAHKPKKKEMILTVHRWFAAKACPGDWLYNRLDKLAKEVTDAISGSDEPTHAKRLYRVQVGAFRKQANAQQLIKRLKIAGFKDSFVKYDDNMYKVQVGAYNKRKNAENMQKKLTLRGFSAIIV